ncbi:MAG: copper resistance protein B [Sphingorhabdus sp.]
MRAAWAILALAALPAAAAAQERDHDHSAMQHGEKPVAEKEMPEKAEQEDHSGHAGHEMEPMPKPAPQASANAASGPPNAADAIWGADAMKEAREALYKEHGDTNIYWVQGDRLEHRAREGSNGYLWDVQGFYGGDIDKFWFKSEGQGSFGEAPEQAEIQALWSRAIGPFFDLQAGVRQDFSRPNRTHLVLGVQGLAPYMFEIDAAAFLSHKGDLTARIEGEYDHRLTQKLIVQPRAEINLSAQDIPALGVGAGIENIELGLRLRYEIKPEFAPYIGVEQEWKTGKSRDFAIASGEDASITNYVIGIRIWF